jgi:parallel beta-helix repeat protein
MDKKPVLFKRMLVIGILVLFIGMSINQSTGTNIEKITIKSTVSRGYIQDLIDNASDGDTIYITSGTYYENVVIDKSINLIGEDKNTTIIDAGGSGNVVTISANGVNITGFTITNASGFYNAGIDITSNYNNVTNCSIISNIWFGIHMDYACYNTIRDNTITDNIRGIKIYRNTSYNNEISYNNISSNEDYGVIVWYSDSNIIIYNTVVSNGWEGIGFDDSRHNLIADNYISLNRAGIEIRYSPNNIILNNTFVMNGIRVWGGSLEQWNTHTLKNNTVNGQPIYYFKDTSGINVPSDMAQVILANCTEGLIEGINTSNVDYGIQIGFSSDITIIENNIFSNIDGINLIKSTNNTITSNNITSNNNLGIGLLISSNNIITCNNITSNKYFGIILESSSNNSIFHNNIMNTFQNAYDECNNTWDDGYPSGGNFWSDYNGMDENGDGIGDTPYLIPGGDNVDRYPLGNFRPDKPTIDGPSHGTVGVTYDYTFSATDPDNSIIYLYVDWGDDSNTGWIGPYDSGQQVTLSHKWKEENTFTIKAKAKDSYDAEGHWATLDVTIPRDKAIKRPILNWLQYHSNLFPLLQKLIQQLSFGK